jgi:adenylosuccinate synthase
MINGYDSLNLTKLDILDTLAEIKVAVKYLVDETELPGFPGSSAPSSLSYNSSHSMSHVVADLDVLSKVEVLYVTLPGWQTSIATINNFDALPDNCKKYIGFIESFLGIPIEWIGVGAGRESMFKKNL